VQKNFIKTYCLIFILILLILSLSSSTQHRLREHSISFISPFWHHLLNFKSFFTASSLSTNSLAIQEERNFLQIENELLKNQIHEWQQLMRQNPSEPVLSNWTFIDQATPARVIFRSWDRWNQSLWINVGQSTNQSLEIPVIAKNSPVVIGRTVIGLIDYVGQTQSHVRLLTDPQLHPAVRAVRGREQDLQLYDQIDSLLQQLGRKKYAALSPDQQAHLVELLTQFKNNLQLAKKSFYLAKGELQGGVTWFNKQEEPLLKGIGFNYDFADAEGEARDLRTGKGHAHPQEPAIPLLKVDDILITTGMDGIFPPGLPVARIKKIGLLKEGDYFYNLEAKPLVNPLEDFSLVFVLPPLSQDEQELTSH